MTRHDEEKGTSEKGKQPPVREVNNNAMSSYSEVSNAWRRQCRAIKLKGVDIRQLNIFPQKICIKSGACMSSMKKAPVHLVMLNADFHTMFLKTGKK